MTMLRLALSLLITCTAASGQIQRHPLPFEQERECVFTCLSWEDSISTLYYRTLEPLKPGERPAPDQFHGQLVLNGVKTNAPSGTRSTPCVYKGPQTLEFFSIPPAVTPMKKEFIPEPIAQVSIPATAKRLCLLFFRQTPPPDHPNLRFRAELIPDSLEDIPLGTYLLFNATSKKLLGSYSDTSFVLEPGAAMKRKLDWPTGLDLEWRFWEADNPKRPVHTSLWRHKKDVRSIIFIRSVEGDDTALQVKAITEYGEPAQP